jgi:hypothetical protein
MSAWDPGLDDVRIEQVRDPRRLEIAPGFVAVHQSSRLRAALRIMIDSGGTVFGAFCGSVLVAYVADVPYASVGFGPGEHPRRWQALAEAREGVIEVARGFRGAGIARRLLERSTSGHRLDRTILIGQALVWHWDLGGQGISGFEYRARLLSLLLSAGFCWYETTDPEISHDEYNFLVARIGPYVSAEARRAFEAELFA